MAMTQATEIKEVLITVLADKLDAHVASSGFARNSRSTTYKRTVGSADQAVEVLLQSRPKDNTSASAALYPYFSVVMPEVEASVALMKVDDRLSSPGLTYRQPAGFASAKADPGRWFIYQEDSVGAVVAQFAAFWDQWLSPLLDELTAPADLLRLYECSDPRLIVTEQMGLRIAAAALLVRGHGEARLILERRFGNAGLRRRYAGAFESLES